MEKTLEVQLKEQRELLINKIIKNLEWQALDIIDSGYYSPNDSAVLAKAYRQIAKDIRRYK